ncbi:MAG: monovalent cation/H(+) antiporter subunit G [Desulfovermiculus sp.]|nr:monovalent cation/H(+) antiporter subunit G [Desulfovermiculus sp.]
MILLQALSVLLCLVGGVFFLGGTVGLLRFPDTYSRLHALTKADNLGLGFVVLGLMTRTANISELIMLALIWFLALVGSSSACYLIANHIRSEAEDTGERDDLGL